MFFFHTRKNFKISDNLGSNHITKHKKKHNKHQLTLRKPFSSRNITPLGTSLVYEQLKIRMLPSNFRLAWSSLLKKINRRLFCWIRSTRTGATQDDQNLYQAKQQRHGSQSSENSNGHVGTAAEHGAFLFY